MTSTTVDPRLVEILEAIVDEYDGQVPEERERLWHVRTMGWQGINGWGDDRPTVTRDDLDELHDFGLVDLDFSGDGSYQVKPSAYGRDQIRTIRRETSMMETAEPVELDWSAVRPILHAVVDAWTEHGASPSAHIFGATIAEKADCANDVHLVRKCQALANAGWIDLNFTADDQLRAQPTMQGVIATRDWPGARDDALAEQVLSRLDKFVARETNPARKKKLQGLRNAAVEVGTKTLAQLVANSVGTAM